MAAAQFWANPVEAADSTQPTTKIPRKPLHAMMKTSNVTILTQTVNKARHAAQMPRLRRKWHVSPPVQFTPHRQVFHAGGKKTGGPRDNSHDFLPADKPPSQQPETGSPPDSQTPDDSAEEPQVPRLARNRQLANVTGDQVHVK